MSVHQLYDPFPVFSGLLGTEPAPGGKLYFFELGTTTPKATYQDYGLTTPNENPIVLDAAGRVESPVFLSGDYSVRLDDADDSTVSGPVEVRSPVAPGAGIPDQTGHAGEFLSTDGVNAAWAVLIPLPDPTGSPGWMVVVNGDGSGYSLQPQPTAASLDIVVESSRIRLTDDDGNKMQFVRGTAATSTGTGTKHATGTVTYPNVFSSPVIPMVTATGGPFAPGNGVTGYWGDISVTAYDANGFTFAVNTNHGESNADGNISGAITVSFQAWGPIA